MKRVLLGAALATLLVIGGTASAGGALECGLGLSVHNNAQCTAPGTITLDGEPSFSIAVAIGPAVGVYSGDVTAVMRGVTSGAELHYNCVFRATNGFGLASQSCETHEDGTFVSGEEVTCRGISSGVGEWAVACRVNSEG